MNDYISIKPSIEELSRLNIRPYVTRYAEVGVQEGNSLAYMLKTFPSIEYLLLCDTWGGVHGGTNRGDNNHIIKLLSDCNYTGRVDFVNGDSTAELPKYFERSHPKFDIAFIDAAHQATPFWNDLHSMNRRAGLIICHDFLMVGMREVAAAFSIENRGWYNMLSIKSDRHGACIFIDIDYINKLKKEISRHNFNGYNIQYYDMLLVKDAATAKKINQIRWDFIEEYKPEIVLDYGCASNNFGIYRPGKVVVDSYDIGLLGGVRYPQTGIRHDKYDVVCFWDVLEHVDWKSSPDSDIENAIKSAHLIAATVPVVPQTGLPGDWRHTRPEHLTYFTEIEFINFMKAFGLELVKSGAPECPPRKDVMSFLFQNTGRN